MAAAAWSSFVAIMFYLHLHISSLQALDFTKFSKLDLPPGVVSPDSAFLDRNGEGPYVGVTDGRILKYNGSYFEDFAYISPNRTKEECDGVSGVISPNLRRKCGRPLGFAYHSETRNLYIVGAFGNLYVVGPGGGLATLLVNQTNDEVTFNYLNGIDLHGDMVYFTDESLNYNFLDLLEGNPYPEGDSTGRLIAYNIKTREVNALLQGVSRPVGPAVSSDGKSIVYSSRADLRVYKYSVRHGTTQALLTPLPGVPSKTKRAPKLLPLLPLLSVDTFWVAVNVQHQPGGVVFPFAYKFDSLGNIRVNMSLTEDFPNTTVVVVQEYNQNLVGEKLYVGARRVPYLGVYRKII